MTVLCSTFQFLIHHSFHDNYPFYTLVREMPVYALLLIREVVFTVTQMEKSLKPPTFLLFKHVFNKIISQCNIYSIWWFSDGAPAGGLVFGIPLTQCVENDRLSRAAAGTSPFRSRGELSGSHEEPVTIGRHGSRASFSSLFDAPRGDEVNNL